MKFCFEKKDFIENDYQPNKTAVVGDDFELTWQQFSERVNLLCKDFNDNNMSDIQYPVVVYGHKSANMIVAMYAMMKLEIAYVPVDVIYPKERILKVMSLSNCQFVINTTSEVLGVEGTTEMVLGRQTVEYSQSLSEYAKEARKPDPLVYVIFTSGSTGEPKGVQISTGAVRSFVKWMINDFDFSKDEVFINSAILSFDLSVFEVMTFGGLGGTILLNSKEYVSSPELMMKRIKRYGGTTWVSTPSYALKYARMGVVTALNSIQTFLFCGEILPHALAKNLLQNFKSSKVLNTYGPTEATVATTLIEITKEVLELHNPLPVGHSKSESELLIQNGEIIIVGDNVSVGYLNSPELNEQKFTVIDGQRAFKTGDKGELRDGNLFFTGRNDDLIKLHGYRIELNEISSVLGDLEYVEQAETIALKRNGVAKKIVSLVQLSKGMVATSEDIKKGLSRKLPHYMVPSDIKFVDAIPLNQNGKADKKLLVEIYLKR
jgi:D-alanine--poly(phosphoribitol) ligase subunit 1